MDARNVVGPMVDPRVGCPEQISRVEAVTLTRGRGDGVRAFEVDNAAGLQLTCVADRALDVARLKWKGIALCWQSQNEVASPAFYDQHGDGFLKSFFGGMVTTCGLTNFGPGGTDKWGEIGLHGRINHIAAENVCARRAPEEPSLRISGTMRETNIFGPNFRLDREWRISSVDSRMELHDRVINEGGSSWPHMLLYHCNAGFPLLDKNTEVTLSHRAMRPRDVAAEKGEDVWNRSAAPDPSFQEQVFIHTMQPAEGTDAIAIIANRDLAGGLALRIRFNPGQLPVAFTWRMLGVGTYVFAVEPANCEAIEGRISATKSGGLPMLEPGETRHYDLVFDVLDGLAALNEALQRLA